MKKIFTFFAVALLAISANAQTAKISAEDIVVLADDETETYLEINLNNDFPVSAWQANVELPDGIVIDGGELTDRCNQKRNKYTGTLGTTLASDGSYLITFYEATDDATKEMYAIAAGEGPVAKLALYTNSKFPEGSEGVIKVRDTQWALGDGKTSYPGILDDGTEAPLEVKVKSVSAEEFTAIKGISMDNLKNAEIFNMSGQRVANATKGLYIINGKKVYVK